MNNAIKIAVHDGFEGEAKIIKDEPSRLFIEIIVDKNIIYEMVE